MKRINSRDELKYKKWYYITRKRDGHKHVNNKKHIVRWNSYRTDLNFMENYDIFELDNLEERNAVKHMIELVS